MISWFYKNLNAVRSSVSRQHVYDAGQLVIRNFLLLVVGLFVTKVLTSEFDREGFGTYQFVLAIIASLSFISLPALNTITLQETAKGRHGVLNHVLKIRLKASMFNGTILLLVAGYYGLYTDKTDVGFGLALVSFIFPIASCFDGYQHYLLGRKEYNLYARLPVTFAIVTAMIIATVAWLTKNAIMVLLFSGIGQLLASGFVYLYVIRIVPPQNKEFSFSAIRFGKGLSGLAILGTISAQMSTLLVGNFLSLNEVAILTMIRMPMLKSRMFLQAISQYVSPKIQSQSGKTLFIQTEKILIVYMGFILGLVVGLVLFVPVLYKVLFPKYIDTVLLAQLGAVTLLVNAPSTILEMSLLSQERLNQLAIIRPVQFFADIVIVACCLYFFKVPGIVLARFLAGVVRTSQTGYFYLKNRQEAFQG